MSKYSLLHYPENPKVQPNWSTREDTLRFFIHSVANYQKSEGRPFGENKMFEKILLMSKKLKEGTLWDFSTSVLSENSNKIEGETLGNFLTKKKDEQTLKYSQGVPVVPVQFLS